MSTTEIVIACILGGIAFNYLFFVLMALAITSGAGAGLKSSKRKSK